MARDKTLEALITHLSNALGHARQYSLDHALVLRTIRSAREALTATCENERQDSVRIRLEDGQFVGQAGLMIGATISGHKLIEVMRRSSAGQIVVGRGAQEDDLLAFLRFALETRSGEPVALTEAQASLAQCGCRQMELQRTDEKLVWFDDTKSQARWNDVGIELGESVAVYQTMFETVESSMRRAASGDSIDINEARTVGEQLGQASKDGFDNVFQLANYPNYDTYTVGHSIRVALLAAYVGSRLGAAPEALTEISAAGLMHDVGKGRIPYEILYKPGKLDAEEWRVVAKHPHLGAEILIESEEPSPYALGAAWGHHLRFDGSGYPHPSPWARTTRVTALIQVCDVFEALTAERPYKAAMPPARAYEIMFGQRGAFDPAILAAFARTLGLYPPGSFVRLSDGRLGRVHRPSQVLDRPSMRVLPTSNMLQLEDPECAHLSVLGVLPEDQALEELERGHPVAPLPHAKEEDSQEVEEPQAEAEAGPGSEDCRLC